MPKLVYDFAEGNKDMVQLLGGKGANLAEMTNLGLPVPPGFTISTEACKVYLDTGAVPAELAEEIDRHVDLLQQTMGKKLGQADDPLLVSVRSGAAVSMPGMMETVLNVGLNDDSVTGLAHQSGSPRFAWDAYRRLIQMFGKTVLGMDGDVFEDAIEAAKQAKGSQSDLDLDADDLKALVQTFKAAVREHTGRDFPQNPREQMDLAIEAVFGSWNAERAILYRRQERIAADLGTAVNICSMVFGNLGMDSGTGVAFTRDPATGQPGVYGDYLQNAQGEDVVAGIRNTVPLAELERIDKASYDDLMAIMAKLEEHYRDLCDIEFTVERGKLWMLQTRVGKRTAAAAFRIATSLVDEGVIDTDEALRRVKGAQLAQLMFPRFDADADKQLLTKAIGASPGAASGTVVLTSAAAVEAAERGEKVILVRRETNPDDLHGMIAAQGVLTSRGGKTSHAAVVARGMGKTCVCGAEELDVNVAEGIIKVNGTVVEDGATISIDGSTGEVFVGEVPVVPSPVVQYFEGTLAPDAGDELVASVHRLITHADERRRLGVRTNADTADDAARARRFGAEGIGLCRTEHMFLGERRESIERLILAEDDADREAALAELEPLQRGDFLELLTAMDGLPVTIRLIDPPLHEFLPSMEDLAVKVALAKERGDDPGRDAALLVAVERLHEQNPMLGLRGVRLGLVVPGLFAMQVRAIASAAAELRAQGKNPRPEIMIPLVGAVQELHLARDEVERVLTDYGATAGTSAPTSAPGGTAAFTPVSAPTSGGTPVPGGTPASTPAPASGSTGTPASASGTSVSGAPVPPSGGRAPGASAAVSPDTSSPEDPAEWKIPVGTMIELPRAAVIADQIAEAADFFSFGTNDLTQTTWGFSRDDVEGAFFSRYLEKGIFAVSPFESIDREGVGALVRTGVDRGRATRPGLKLGICGEHGGDPDSIHFFHEVGLDYVSCSPFRIPVARLEAGRATLD